MSGKIRPFPPSSPPHPNLVSIRHQSPDSPSASVRKIPLRILLTYWSVGAAWICLSSAWGADRFHPAGEWARFELFKGLGFVLVTGLLLWLLCFWWARRVDEAWRKYSASSRRFEAYVKASPVAIARLSPEGKIRDANDAACELTGYPKAELLDKDIHHLDAEIAAGAGGTREAFEAVFHSENYSLERRIRRRDGTTVYTHIRGAELEDGDALFYVTDISDKKAHEARLKKLNDTLRALRNIDRTIVRETDIEGLLTSASGTLADDRGFGLVWIGVRDSDRELQLWQASTGAAPAEKEAWRDFFKDTSVENRAGAETLNEDVTVARDFRSVFPDAPESETTAANTAAFLHVPFRDDQVDGFLAVTTDPHMPDDAEELRLFTEIAGDIAHAIASLRTRTQREEAFRQLDAAKREAEKANKAKEEFLAVMSHEMRTPLNPILGYCELLEDSLRDTDDRSAVEQIRNAATHLLGLIDEILFFTDLHKGDGSVETETFRVSACCEEALANAPAPKAGVSVQFDRSPPDGEAIPGDLCVRADRVKLLRILANLLSNACKYTRQGWIRLSVGLRRCEGNEAELVARVEDTGVGIDPEHVDDLFEPFSQADASYARAYEGVGIGLATCRKLADLMGGVIDVDSDVGKGSRFTVRLPVRIAESGYDSPEPIAATATDTDGNGGPRRILVVEDNEANVRVIERMLRSPDNSVTVARDGARAVELCGDTPFDLILMDLSMPVLDGFRATRRIRSSGGPNAETPVIALTAHATEEAKRDGFAAGMADYLIKPVRPATLRDTVGRHARRA